MRSSTRNARGKAVSRLQQNSYAERPGVARSSLMQHGARTVDVVKTVKHKRFPEIQKQSQQQCMRIPHPVSISPLVQCPTLGFHRSRTSRQPAWLHRLLPRLASPPTAHLIQTSDSQQGARSAVHMRLQPTNMSTPVPSENPARRSDHAMLRQVTHASARQALSLTQLK
jgi:hypothetical protein